MLIENLVKFNILINLKPELVEKKEPPIITNNKNKKDKLYEISVNDIPIFDTLLHIEKSMFKKILSLLKKTKKIKIVKSRYINRYKSSLKKFVFLFFFKKNIKKKKQTKIRKQHQQ